MRQKTVLITGGIGSGKSTVARYLQEIYGIPVFFADDEAKKLYKDPAFLEQLNSIVGGGIINKDGLFDKKALAEIIFNDERKKKAVEEFVHPKVREMFNQWKNTKLCPIVIMESAIALKNGRKDFDYVIMIEASEAIRLNRVLKRDGDSIEKIRKRMSSQTFNYKLIDFFVQNETDFDFKTEIDRVISTINTPNTALFAGSFDPFTNGHLSILKKACGIFDKVYLCIANNADKKRRYPIEKMQKAIKKTISNRNLTNCEVVVCDHLIADFCKELGVKYLIRGLRNTTDYLYEENISKINHEINQHLETVYLRGDDDIISSSMVYEFIKYGKPVEKYVPKSVLQLIQPKLKKQQWKTYV